MILKRKNDKGFTLIETLVAITILTFAIMGPMTAINVTLNASRAAQEQLTASYLAQEGLEFMHAINSDNFLNGSASPLNISQCMDGNECTIDASDQFNPPQQCYGSCEPLYVSYNHVYNQQGDGTPTRYTRLVRLTPLTNYPDFNLENDYPVEVSVTVSWQGKQGLRSITLKEALYHW